MAKAQITRYCFTGSDPYALGLSLDETFFVPNSEPEAVELDDVELDVRPPWKQAIRDHIGREVTIRFDGNQFVLVDSRKAFCKVRKTLLRQPVFEACKDVAFELMSTRSRFNNAWPSDYRAPGFSGGHLSHGWACAFKGAGHNRLVSRRWLEYGPWCLIRDEESDLSFIQFHDLEADAETALEQAKPGHQRMGIDDEGGFIQTDYVWETDFSGFYIPEERQYRIVVTGRDVAAVEMLDACALRYYQRLGEDKPIDSIAYVFIMEEDARKHLHELWLRELECWAIIEGKEIRLDADYDPPPQKPQWVLDVEAREAKL